MSRFRSHCAMRHERAVNDRDDAERHDEDRKAVRGGREDGEGDAQDAVSAELQQDAGQDDRPGGRRGGVGVGQPGVERPTRDLDRKGEEEGEERQAGQQHVVGVRLRALGLDDVEAAGNEVDREDRQQHEDRAGHGVEEELDCRVLGPVFRLAPNPDQEVHRHEADLPEHVEEHEVERDKHAQHAHLEQEEQEEELAHPRLDGAGGVPEAKRGQERGQENEGHAQAIHAHVEGDVERGDPGRHYLELHASQSLVVGKPQVDREAQRERADRDGARLDKPFLPSLVEVEPLAPRQQREDGADKRDEGDNGQQLVIHQRALRWTGCE